MAEGGVVYNAGGGYSMATPIDTIEDLMRVLDEHPQWLEAMRARLLSREILELPSVVARLAHSVDERFDRVEVRMDRLEAGLEGLRQDNAPIKAAYARNAAVLQADLIAARFGLSFTRVLTSDEVTALSRTEGMADVPVNEMISFRSADLVIEGADAAGETCYVTAEISFTLDERDTARAARNAGLLARCTGRPAHPAVAGLRVDDRIRSVVETGGVYWHELTPEHLKIRAD